MKIINYNYFFIIFFIFLLLNPTISEAAKKTNNNNEVKKNVLSELYIFTKDNNKSKVVKNTKNITEISSKIPKPKKYRSTIEYNFIDDYINKHLLPYEFANLDSKNFNITEKFDLNYNKINDVIINFNNPITALLDLNENGFYEVEYIFNGSERYVYLDENEDKLIDYVFIDYNGDGIDEEIIKIEN